MPVKPIDVLLSCPYRPQMTADRDLGDMHQQVCVWAVSALCKGVTGDMHASSPGAAVGDMLCCRKGDKGTQVMGTCQQAGMGADGKTAFLPLAASCSIALSRARAAFAFKASLAAACPCRHSTIVIGVLSTAWHDDDCIRAVRI